MKILKKFLAATLAFAMAASVTTTGFAMADAATAKYQLKIDVSEPYVDSDVTYVDASVYLGKVEGDKLVAFSSDYGCTVGFKTNFDKNNVDYVSYVTENDTITNTITVAYRSGRDQLNFTIGNDGSTLTFDPTKALFKIKFKVLQADAGSYSIWSKWSDVSFVDESDNLVTGTNSDASKNNLTVPVATDVKYTIAAAGGDDDTISATGAAAANGANTTTYTFENSDAMAGKKVVMQNAKMPTTGMTADTRFIVSDGTRTQIFGSDIWARLGAEGDGVIDVANVIFGIIVDAANTSTFTFEVK